MQKSIPYLIILNLIVILSACGRGFETKNSGFVDPKLKPYLDTFLKFANQNGRGFDTIDLDMSFSESMPVTANGAAIGYCRASRDLKRVVIKGSYWDTASVSDREQIVFHELGHCLLGIRDHIDTVENAPVWNNPAFTAIGVPSSIMNTFHFDGAFYNGNRSEYVKRLFSNATSMPLYYNAPSQIGSDEYIF